MSFSQSSKRSNIRRLSYLPEELVVELLSKLPAKSIFRFRCVSKQWLHLLSSSQGPHSVKNLHSKRHNPTPFLLAWNEARYDVWYGRQDVRPDVPKRPRNNDYSYYRMYSIDMFTNKSHHEFTLDIPGQYQHIVSCHGLVFFVCDDNQRGLLGVVHVCNPSTGETIELPKLTRDNNKVYTVGFGYLPSVNQYKVVRWFDNNYAEDWFEDDDNAENWLDGDHAADRLDSTYAKGFEIISLIDGGKADSYSWRSVESRGVCLGHVNKHLCVKGVIYWLITSNQEVLAFDLETEKHEIISVPSPDVGHWELIELKGSLCLAEYVGSQRIDKIWMLNDKEYYSEWSPTYSIGEWFAYLIDSSFITDNRKEGAVFVSWDDAFRCNSCNSNVTYKLTGIPNLEFGSFELHPCVYFDSLFSLNQSETDNV